MKINLYMYTYTHEKIKIVKCLTTKIYLFKVNVSHFSKIPRSQIPIVTSTCSNTKKKNINVTTNKTDNLLLL